MFLGIDCGTQGTKALLIDRNGRLLGQGHAPHELTEGANGRREQDPALWVAAMTTAVRGAMREAGAAPADVRALAISGQQHGLVALDESGAPLHPAKLWCDTETAPQNAALIARLGGPAAWLERVGLVPRTGYTISKLLWLKETHPDRFARIRHLLLPHDYLNFRLTGRCVAECGDASGTGFFDIRARTWSAEALALIDGGTGPLARALPPLVAPDAVIGPLTPAAAAALGLTPSCLVAAGGGDNMMAAIGTGVVRAGLATLSLGTSATLYSFSDTPPADPSGAVAPFCASSGGWLALVCTMNATTAVDATLALLGRTHDFIAEALEATPPGADGLTFLPFLNGERTPDLPDARGTLCGLSGATLSPAPLLRAALEGVCFNILDGMGPVLGAHPVHRITLVGGGARSAGWRQMIADIAGVEIVVPTTAEAGCLGAAIQARWAASRAAGAPENLDDIVEHCVSLDPALGCTPDPRRHAAYAASFALYRARLAEIYRV